MELADKEKQIIDHYGLRNQLKHLFSEIYELTEAIIEQEIYLQIEEVFNCGVNEEFLKKHTTEEFGDVEHILDQIALKLEIARDEVVKIKEFKADRQLKRIQEEEPEELTTEEAAKNLIKFSKALEEDKKIEFEYIEEYFVPQEFLRDGSGRTKPDKNSKEYRINQLIINQRKLINIVNELKKEGKK